MYQKISASDAAQIVGGFAKGLLVIHEDYMCTAKNGKTYTSPHPTSNGCIGLKTHALAFDSHYPQLPTPPHATGLLVY